MTAPFPKLLRRSAFVTHDPAITRVYTSNPSSTSRYGDWGLKSPISTPKGPRYIKVHSLDTASGIGSDWRSAEKEARFMEMWGDGRVPWMTARENEDSLHQYSKLRDIESQKFNNNRKSGNDYAEPIMSLPAKSKDKTEKVDWLPNLEVMTKKEFDRYLDEVRANRPAYLKRQIGGMEPSLIDKKFPQKEDRTIINHALSGSAHPHDSAQFQSEITADKLSSPSSSELHSSPHHLSGLSYSRQPVSSLPLHPGAVHKGRALNQASAASRQSLRSQAPGNYSSGTNDSWVIGIGGLTAERSMDGSRTSDAPVLTSFDFSRGDKEKGVNHFRIKKAILNSPPKVIDVAHSNLRRRWIRPTISSAVQPNPLDTFRFNINVSEVKPATEEVGSKEWVSREHVRGPGLLSDSLGRSGISPGGPRSGRSVRSWLIDDRDKIAAEKEGQQAQTLKISDILARLQSKREEGL